MRILYLLFTAILFAGNALLALDPVIILLGPPGSGKGTFSQYLKENYNYNHVSIGDTLRREVEQQTELGCKIEECVRNGDYIDPKIIHSLLTKIVLQYQLEDKPFILDGFGQNDGDAEAIYELLTETNLISRSFVLYLEASDEVCRERISNRLICSGCGHVYNTLTATSALFDRCGLCKSILKTRLNDTPEVIIKRLRHYRDHVEYLHKYTTSLFPSIFFDTNGSLQDCIHLYNMLVIEIANCKSDTSTLFAQLSNLESVRLVTKPQMQEIDILK